MYCNNKLKIKFTKKYLTKLMNFPSIFQIKHKMKEKCYKNARNKRLLEYANL